MAFSTKDIGERKFSLLLSLGVIFFVSFVFIPGVSAASCWSYDESNNASCTAANGCIWKSDGWGGWCEELQCWSLWTQDECSTTSVTGSNCSWQGGAGTFVCEETTCWSFTGTNSSACTGADGLSCTWEGSCYSTGAAAGAAGGVSCWDIASESTCVNTTGCGWGSCQEAGCWNYGASASCASLFTTFPVGEALSEK